MPTEVEATTSPRRGLIRAPQDFTAGVALIAIALFAMWATSDLSQGTLRAMGPAMLPRWLAIAVALCGLSLTAFSLIKSGDRLRLTDYIGIISLAAILAVAAIVAAVVNGALYGGSRMGDVFYYSFIFLFYGILLLLFLAILKRHAGFAASGLRGPFFVVAGIIAFALTIRLFGMVVAGPLAMVISGFATDEVREGEILIFAAVLTAACVGLFRYALNLPIPVLIIPGVIHI